MIKAAKRTVSGRVVYNRKFHGFTMRDVERIQRAITTEVMNSQGLPGWFEFLKDIIERVWEYFFDLILGALGVESRYTDVIRQMIVGMCDRLLELLGFNPYFIEDYLAQGGEKSGKKQS
jgi:hypothetical protein